MTKAEMQARRTKLLCAALAIIGLSVVAVLLLWRQRPQISIYQGKSLQAWILQARAGDQNAEAVIKSLGSNAVPDLVRLLKTQDPWFRRQIWQYAVRLPSPWRGRILTKTPALVAAPTRAAAARALGILGPEAQAAIPALAAALNDQEGLVWWGAATALASIGAPAVPSLEKALQDRNPIVRSAAAFALGDIGPEAAVATPSLTRLLEDQNADVRRTAAYSLSLIGTPLSAVDRNIAPAQLQARRAARKIRMQRDRTLHGDIHALAQLAHAESADTRRQALETLAAIHVASPEALGTLSNALNDPSPEVRLAATNALGDAARIRERFAADAPQH